MGLDLDPIKERLAEATPGPWDFHVLPQSVGITVATIHSEHGPRETCWTVDFPPEIGGMGTEKDAEFIANAPEDIAALVAEVERLRGQIDAARAIHKPLDALNMNSNRIGQVCLGCGQDNGNWNEWPCPTIRALEVGE